MSRSVSSSVVDTHTLGSHVSESDAHYYALHHLTALPESVTKFADRTFSQARIERALHMRMEQFTNRDSDRFRQLLRWIKNKQTTRVANGPEADGSLVDGSSGVSLIRRAQFQNILEVLGVFATQAQADNLFDKYDVQRRGFLTLHELMCRASSALESDFTGTSELASGRNEGARSDDMFADRGKRQFLRQKLTGEGERPITPQQNSNLITVPLIVRALREKLRINAKVGDTASIPRARREFARVFEYYDPQQLGAITLEQLVRALHAVNFPLGAQHQRLLLDAFPSAVAPMLMKETSAGTGQGGQLAASVYAVATDAHNRPLQDPSARGFDYVSFILYVFPDGVAAANGASAVGTGSAAFNTSLFLNHDLGKDFFDNMSVEERRKRGLPPTHEQVEAMERQARGERDQEEKEAAFTSPTPSPRAQPMSQFARERAPPTPQIALSAAEHYRTIAGRAPPASWGATAARNPYLQTVLAPPSGSSTARQNGHSYGAGFASPPATASGSRGCTPGGSQTARNYRDGSLPPASPRAPVTPSRYTNGGAANGAPNGGISNALNPFASGSAPQFIPNAAFLNAVPPRTPQQHQYAPHSHSPYAHSPVHAYGSADAFTNILAAPAPARRPTTGITTFVRGTTPAGRPLPPVNAAGANSTPRTPRY